jgi:hypothetical protein
MPEYEGMPIQFRCPHCNQLLSIARRKAGSTTNCPTCDGRVIVPRLPSAQSPSTEKGKEEPNDLLEKDDFDELFRAGNPRAVADPGSGLAFGDPSGRVLTSGPAVNERSARQPAAGPAAPKPGIHLSPSATVWAVVLAICLIVIAFLAGLVVGRFVWYRPPAAKPPVEEVSHLLPVEHALPWAPTRLTLPPPAGDAG